MNLFEQQANEFSSRHIGPNEHETEQMLKVVGVSSLNELINKTVPASIRNKEHLNIPAAVSEFQYLSDLKKVAAKNKVFNSYIGQGYYNTITPSVILRNVFENPGWYTQYTPYQAEISQGRLESLLNFQTMISDLTALPLTNASLLDEGNAAAEAMTMFFHLKNKDTEHLNAPKFFVDTNVYAQTKEVLLTRATPLGIELIFDDYANAKIDNSFFGALIQYPNSYGAVNDYREFINAVHALDGYVAMATDLLALTLLTPPGELGADVAIGSSQRFGVPMGFGGPHAAFFATKDDFKRFIPGRIIGISIDAQGNRALRMALQTREQHIKREKATSNICTAQALLANMAAMYAVYHGPVGLKKIAQRVHLLAIAINNAMKKAGIKQLNNSFFDTLTFEVDNIAEFKKIAEENNSNFMYHKDGKISLAVDEVAAGSVKETTQILAKIFGTFLKKDNSDFILFFDEADSLFDKRSELQ
ncbi:MAG TPA: glycine dehydrogenase (aminomethyl-transferring), partial [Puia sp.]|nr:glycine dehydrogenase (aminomethyl-transferring) [Puia sp.]